MSCRKCGKLSHFAVRCHSKKKEGKDSDARKFVRAVNNPDSDSEVFYANHILAVDHDDSPLVSIKLESGNYLRFQPDTITRTERHHTEVSLSPLSCSSAILAWQQLLSSKRPMHLVGLFPKPIAHWSK